ncbi:MAG: GNAT family N-acetyltransferase [Flexilinea sp.]|nr:GNAT family N-acetyltransferase [Flexilinea sp.]
MDFSHFSEDDYQALCDFLIELNRENRDHINWNWARFEWMYEHPEFDKSLIGAIGLWRDGGKIAGAAIYDMYFGEAFCAVLPGYETLYPEVLEYAKQELKNENGLGIAVCDEDLPAIEAAKRSGFVKADQTDTIMKLEPDRSFPAKLPEGFSFAELDFGKEDLREIQWLFWQGFDHGEDTVEFEKDFERTKDRGLKIRRHFDPRLSIAAIDPAGTKAAYCSLWYDNRTDYAYLEPLCTVPAFRGNGLASAVVYEALNRVKALGAKTVYVISDLPFYEKIGFTKDRHYTFYWNK